MCLVVKLIVTVFTSCTCAFWENVPKRMDNFIFNLPIKT